MITDYATLQSAIASELHRLDLTAKIPQWVQFAEKHFNRKLRVRQQETAYSAALVDGAAALPADFAEFKAVWMNNDFSKKLTAQTAEFVRTRGASSDVARYYALEGSSIICWPAAGTVNASYYAKLQALSDANTTNWLLEEAPDLYFYEALTYSAPHLKNDGRLMTWRAEADRCFNELMSSSRAASISGGPLAARPR